MNKNILEIKNIEFWYQKEMPLFSGLSLSIGRGETIGLVGSNGAGKSTLLKLLVGLQDYEQGKIFVDNIELCQKNIHHVRKKIGFSFQDADSQLFMTNVYEDVAFGPRNQGLNEKEVDKVVIDALKRVGALELAQRPPYKLSGGEKRAVALATVLAMRPELIILDEPTTGLDPRSRRNLIKILNEIEQTKIIATHDMDMALEICDRVVVMHQGGIVMSGEPKDVFMNTTLLESCHLEAPLAMQMCPVCSN